MAHTQTMVRINVAARSAGVSTQLLRAWERRYGLPSPARTASGYRLYSDDDVIVLRGAKVLVDQGQSIAEVARLPRDQLRAAGSKAPTPVAPMPLVVDGFAAAAMTAVRAFDAPGLESLILHATSMGTMPSVEICDRVLVPLLVEIGDRWEKGELDVAAEHFGSAIARRHLHTLAESEARRNAGAPAIVCACPEGDLHEGGLLTFALHAAARGWNIVYLGGNMPIADVAKAAGHDRVTAVAFSLSAPGTRGMRRDLIDSFSRWRAEVPGRHVWLGGRGAAEHAKEYRAAGFELVEQVESFAVSPG